MQDDKPTSYSPVVVHLDTWSSASVSSSLKLGQPLLHASKYLNRQIKSSGILKCVFQMIEDSENNQLNLELLVVSPVYEKRIDVSTRYLPFDEYLYESILDSSSEMADELDMNKIIDWCTDHVNRYM